MKGILVLIDGLGDLPCGKENKTPLESAKKPNLNYLASKGKLGFMFPINEKTAPESDASILTIFKNKLDSSFRGYFEAIGSGLKVEEGDLVMRANFGTIDNLEKRNLIDRRAGRTLTGKEADMLSEEIEKRVNLPCDFTFQNTVQHRGVLILRGGFSDNITNTDPMFHLHGKINTGKEFKFSLPLDDETTTKFSSNTLNEFIEQSFKVLDIHPVNIARKKNNLLKANIILTRDASVTIPVLKKYKNWAAISSMPLEIGIARASGMKTFSFDYPEMTQHNIYKNLYEGLNETISFAVKTLKKESKNFDYFYVHIKETDAPGHDNLPAEKAKMIELLDEKFFSFLKEFAEKNKTKIIITGDHSTPCCLSGHSSDEVPVLFCDWKENEKKDFSEKQALKGEIGKIYGKNLLDLFEK